MCIALPCLTIPGSQFAPPHPNSKQSEREIFTFVRISYFVFIASFIEDISSLWCQLIF